MIPKVYCSQCLNYRTHAWGGGCEKVIGTEDTPYQQQPLTLNPKVANKDNNCEHYIKRVTLAQFIPGRHG